MIKFCGFKDLKQTIEVTTNHPLYINEKGWAAAGDLEIGDTLVTADGDEVEVTDLELEKLAEPILVYNLDVTDFDTYFVGEYGISAYLSEKSCIINFCIIIFMKEVNIYESEY